MQSNKWYYLILFIVLGILMQAYSSHLQSFSLGSPTIVFNSTIIPSSQISSVEKYNITASNWLGSSEIILPHFPNTILHTINTILLFIILTIITSNLFVSVASSLLFMLHPLVSSVLPVPTGTSLLLATFCLLLSLLLYLKQGSLKVRYIPYTLLGSIALYFAAFALHPLTFALPLTILLYEKYVSKSHKYITTIIFWTSAFIITLLVVIVKQAALFKQILITQFGLYLVVRSKLIILSLFHYIMPWTLNPDYTVTVPTAISFSAIITAVALVILFLLSVFVLRKSKSIGFFLLSMLLIISIPSFLSLGPLLSDTMLYIPSLFLSTIIAYLLQKLPEIEFVAGKKKYLVPLSVIFLLIISVFFGIQTLYTNALYLDNALLWQSSLQKNPQSYETWLYLGKYYSDQKNWTQAEATYIEAAKYFGKDSSLLWHNLGSVVFQLNKTEDSLVYLAQALKLPADNFTRAQTHAQVSVVLQKLNQTNASKTHMLLARNYSVSNS